MARNYQDYDGQTSTPFTVLATWIAAGTAFNFEFGTWESTAEFDAGKNEYPPLHKSIIPDQTFQDENTAILGQLKTLCLNEMLLAGRGYTLKEVQWFRVGNIFSSSAEKGDDLRTMQKEQADYTAFITANQALFDQLNEAVWTWTKANYPFFESMIPAT